MSIRITKDLSHDKNNSGTLASDGSLILSTRFHDIDLFLGHIQVQMDVDSTRIDVGPICIDSQMIILGDIAIIRYATTKAIFEHFCLPPDNVLFSFSSSKGKQPCIWCGIPAPPDSIAIMHPGREYTCYNPPGFDVVQIILPENRRVGFDMIPFQEWERTKKPETAIRPVRQRRGLLFRDTLYGLFNRRPQLETLQRNRVLSMMFKEWVLDELAAVLSASFQVPENGKRPKQKSRFDTFHTAIEIIEDHLNQPLPLKDLAEKAGSSTRVLQYAFQDILGIPPMRYMLHRKLHAARFDLRQSQPGANTRVSDIALFFGMSHFGRFSTEYKKLFGESPSFTLRNAWGT